MSCKLMHGCTAAKHVQSCLCAWYNPPATFAGEGLDPGAALHLIRQARPSAQPNMGFMRQLYAYSHKADDAVKYHNTQEVVRATSL